MVYTVKDIEHILPGPFTLGQREAIEAYLNEGTIPPYDPCTSCEPAEIRRMVGVLKRVAARGELGLPVEAPSEPAPQAEAVNVSPTETFAVESCEAEECCGDANNCEYYEE